MNFATIVDLEQKSECLDFMRECSIDSIESISVGTNNTNYSLNACNLLDASEYNTLLRLIDESNNHMQTYLYELMKITLTKLEIFKLISENKLDKAFTLVKSLKDFMISMNKDFTEYAAELTRILATPNFYLSESYIESIDSIKQKVKHLICYEDFYLIDLSSIMDFEKQLLINENLTTIKEIEQKEDSYKDDLSIKPEDSLALSTRCSSREIGLKYFKVENLKVIKFSNIKRENIDKRLIKLFYRALCNISNEYKATTDFQIKSRKFIIQGFSYKSCSNKFISHLFSFNEMYELYENLMVPMMESIFSIIKESILLKNRNLDEKLKWYIVNLHKVFRPNYVVDPEDS